MLSLLLILIPLLTGLAAFLIRDEKAARGWSFLSVLATLVVSVLSVSVMKQPSNLRFEAEWLPALHSNFSLQLDGIGMLLCLLNAVAYPIVLLATWKTNYSNAKNFFALMLLAQAGMMGVFLAADALLFYFFWELALIPMYFLCSIWGGEKRITVTFKFFIYTFVGSLLMLIGLLVVYAHTPLQSFSLESFYNARLSGTQQEWVFWLIFAAFAIKMPIFPFHTWQPDTYEQAPGATTMILSGVMVKMGVFGMLRWLMPVVPIAFFRWGNFTSSLAVIGMLYASLIAIKQDNLKRLVAYSSIAHVGLMCVAIFSENISSTQGAVIQMFNHGINIIGLWIVVELIARQFGTYKISELGGLAQKAPSLAILLVIVALANIGLPLTNAFPGEFLMFNGILNSKFTEYNVVFTVLAGLTIILAAIYMLNMIRKVFYGNTNELTEKAVDINWNERLALGIVVIIIFWFGICPQTLLNQASETTEFLMKKADLSMFFK